MDEIKSYEFWTLDNDFLEIIETSDPSGCIGELAAMHSVPADEIEWVEYDPAAWGVEVEAC